MIYPEAYYAAHKEASTPEELGRIGFALIGRGDELNPPLSGAERFLVKTIARCNDWHTENREALKSKWKDAKRRQRDADQKSDVRQCPQDNGGHGMSTNVHETTVDMECPRDNGGQAMSTTSINQSIYQSTNLPTNQPTNKQENINRSVPVKRTANGNGNGNGGFKFDLNQAVRDATRFVSAVLKDKGEFFNPEHSAITILQAVTWDFESTNRWAQLIRAKGEDACRATAEQFFSEIKAGESVNNKGAALNARLSKLQDINDGN